MNLISGCWTMLLVVLLSIDGAQAEGAEKIQGPIGLVGLVSDGKGQDKVAVLSQAAWQALHAQNGMDVLTGADVIRRLGGERVVCQEPVDLERLRGWFQEGYLKSYQFEYRRAEERLGKVLAGLECLPPSPAGWDLYVQANIFLGITKTGQKDIQAAYQAFWNILRTQPNMKLSRANHSPRTRKIWNQAQKKLPTLRRGELTVESEPRGAKIFLDGIELGKTPFRKLVIQGRYRLEIEHPVAGKVSGWVEVGKEPKKYSFQLMFQGAMALDGAHAIINIPQGKKTLPSKWWPWLGAMLGTRWLVVISVPEPEQWMASLVDLERGQRVREGWLKPRGHSLDEVNQDAQDLVRFLITGKGTDRLRVTEPTKPKPKPPKEKPKVDATPPPEKQIAVAPTPPTQTEISTALTKPTHSYSFWAKLFFWTGLGMAATGGVAGYFADQAAEDYRWGGSFDHANASRNLTGLMYTGLGLGAACMATGLVLWLTTQPDSGPPKHTATIVTPLPKANGISFTLQGRW